MAEEFDKKVLAPYHYILTAKSNYLCATKLPLCLNHWFKVPKERMDEIMGIMHHCLNPILMIDDIQDSSMYRRSLPAAHCVYGVPLTINAAVHSLLIGLEKLIRTGHPKGPEVFAKSLTDYWRGQGMDLYWRDNLICPTEDEYNLGAIMKTGSFVWLPLGMMQLFSEDKRDYTRLVEMFAIYYQIRDEYCSISKPESLEEKSSITKLKGINDTHICEDISEGKFSFPIIHALKSSEASNILNILKQHTRDVQLKKKCLSLMDQVGSLQYTRDKLYSLDRECRIEIQRLGGNPILEQLMDDLLNWDN